MRTTSKADHVRRARQTRRHGCHWPGCRQQVPPAMWGCRTHWFLIPKPLRDAIWRTYRPGQEEGGGVSTDYFEAAAAVQDWIRREGEGQ